jgi:hypothetical protein
MVAEASAEPSDGAKSATLIKPGLGADGSHKAGVQATASAAMKTPICKTPFFISIHCDCFRLPSAAIDSGYWTVITKDSGMRETWHDTGSPSTSVP